eukprot:TRINITY_DN17465_c0_g1_i1.p1 TRINITY_DN17465_c0_g1~~TRINITY_DN17465_c0_g1_i1.p1  ORF type:complete len:283 (-),score=-15.65 TRINITY_DN17465_c0_g1_i1:406-1254(-)
MNRATLQASTLSLRASMTSTAIPSALAVPPRRSSDHMSRGIASPCSPVCHHGWDSPLSKAQGARSSVSLRFLEAEPLEARQRHKQPAVPRFAVDAPCCPLDLEVDTNRVSAWDGPSFLAEASIGLVECTSRGCRPVFRPRATSRQQSEGNVATETPEADSSAASPLDGAEMEGRAVAYRERQERYSMGSLGPASLPTEIAEFVNEVWVEPVTAEKYYRDAIRQSPYDVRLLTSFAQFSWRRLRDKVQAEDLYKKALNESPQNSDALASYALFLWESESESEN